MSYYWRWKSTIIDFSKIPDEYPIGRIGETKKERIFRCLPLPDGEEHECREGWYSLECLEALSYASEYGLVELVEEEEE